MRMTQQDSVFAPIALVCETREEANALWDLARFTDCSGESLSPEAQKLAIKISNWLSSEAKF